MSISNDVCHHRGQQTYQVSQSLFAKNRSRLVEAFNGETAGSFIVLQGGKYETRYCSDHEPLFRQESYFFWTFGVDEPDYYGAINLNNGQSFLFAPRLPESYAIWMGKIKQLDEIRSRFGVDQVFYNDQISEKLRELGANNLLVLYGKNTDSGKYSQAAEFPGISDFHVDRDRLHPVMSILRSYKTDEEIDLLRYVSKISSEAHIDVMKKAKPGMLEYQLESIFYHYCLFHGGCRFLSYTCICGTGRNSAILHYGHAGEPNGRKIEDGDICLFDMGSEYACYASDITCSFPVNGRFNEEQKVIYNAVLKANFAVRENAKPGVSWTDMHLLAERIELNELTQAGLLSGDLDEMMDARLGAVFMPHGLGHLLGIDTHDVGGYPPQAPPRSELVGLKSLRTARILEERMVLTIEPGIYFIDFLLEAALKDPRQSKFLRMDVIQNYRHVGGVRIEDVVLITNNGVEVLSNVPRTVEEIETVMNLQ